MPPDSAVAAEVETLVFAVPRGRRGHSRIGMPHGHSFPGNKLLEIPRKGEPRKMTN